MALIIAGGYMVRYPLGGMLSWGLQWLIGLKRLGHKVVFVEKSHYPDSCYNPRLRSVGNDYEYGLKTTAELLSRFGFPDQWCYVDYYGNYHGMPRERIEATFREADLYLDLGSHGSWKEEAALSAVRALVDGEPGYTQIRMESGVLNTLDDYDYFFSNGTEIGQQHCPVPTCDKKWIGAFNPVDTEVYSVAPPPNNGAYSTVMNWKAHASFTWQGRSYGQKDVEFEKFIDLPGLLTVPMEIAVSGKNIPRHRLASAGWAVRDAQEVTASFDSYSRYIASCRGEFSVCKSVFVELATGWFSDRSAAYLASGRPVVLQDTGFSRHLPAGEGLFAVKNEEQAVDAITEIESNYEFHSRMARQIAAEYLDSKVVLGKLLDEINI